MPSRAKQISIGVLGGKGMLGGDLVVFLAKHFSVEAIDKDTYESCKGKSYDVLINANGNSKRFWANDHPLEDFYASTVSVYQSIADFSFTTYIYLSSSDVYEDHTSPLSTREEQAINPRNLSPYGFHKYLSEEIVKHATKHYLILRSSLILGSNLRKGPFYDILQGNPLFVTLKSKLQIITTKAIADTIHYLVQSEITNKTLNMGGKGVFTLSSVKSLFKKPVTVSPDAKTQQYEMNVETLQAHYPLKTSAEYVEEFFKHHGYISTL